MKNIYIVIAIALLPTAMFAQGTPSSEPGPNVMFFQSAIAAPPGVAMGGGAGMFTMALPGNDKVITGAPYTANVSTEMIQTLSDGNRISNKTEASIARDSRGRTRREETMGMAGPWQVNGPKLIFINDPDSQTSIVLDPDKQSATTMKLPSFSSLPLPPLPPLPANGASAGVSVSTNGPAVGVGVTYFERHTAGSPTEETKTEALGVQTMEGVSVEGKRVTRKIPAGQIGNTRDIEITSEVWYSPDLQVVVMSKHNDPRFGETIYRLSRIERLEPDHSLFETPPGYTVQNASFGKPLAGQ